ncbi:dehydrodolichyl diphosphate synthase complex subunit Dhdds [Ixodes scapularis]|uniref:dehydrodolichyl diphosphate synthase complex subunit Dhdds n=1 Tax=Ixodes scapularis TaxID=6945 RepID=UPI001161C2EF|nr:dehydrodolichyl diphosphate synthase complex subunit Dhdds [Ixodes scapularis]XP_029821917.1 dehydrodolichyl diphosphate synthase complex subunit Dhdds [Ixodes scapularis]
MSWIHETRLTWLQAAAVRVLKTGKIPTHLAVIMDGNRRFAKKQNMQCVEGHLHGFEKLSEVLFWCSELGITEVTVYAFSIENFKRSKEEVDGLMDLALKKLESLLNEMEKIHEKGLCVRVLGNLSYLPVEVQKVIADVVLQTQHNTRCYLNICISYTSREEMCNAIQELAAGVQEGLLSPDDVTEESLSHALYSRNSKDPALVIRTSGEVRLSDFLLWQSSHSVLEFVSVLWPEFSIWHLLAAVLWYQRQESLLEQLRQENPKETSHEESGGVNQEAIQQFLENVETRWQKKLHAMRLGQTTQKLVMNCV